MAVVLDACAAESPHPSIWYAFSDTAERHNQEATMNDRILIGEPVELMAVLTPPSGAPVGYAIPTTGLVYRLHKAGREFAAVQAVIVDVTQTGGVVTAFPSLSEMHTNALDAGIWAWSILDGGFTLASGDIPVSAPLPDVGAQPEPTVFDVSFADYLALGGDGITEVEWEQYRRKAARVIRRVTFGRDATDYPELIAEAIVATADALYAASKPSSITFGADYRETYNNAPRSAESAARSVLNETGLTYRGL